jgi:hypothetical protein
MSYWNEPTRSDGTKSRGWGVFTAVVGTKFNSDAQGVFMSLYQGPGSSVNLLPVGLSRLHAFENLSLEWYATHLKEIDAFKPAKSSEL